MRDVSPTYDPKVYDLAEYFLRDYAAADLPSATRWVAQRIQKGIEDDLEDLKRDGHIHER